MRYYLLYEDYNIKDQIPIKESAWIDLKSALARLQALVKDTSRDVECTTRALNIMTDTVYPGLFSTASDFTESDKKLIERYFPDVVFC